MKTIFNSRKKPDVQLPEASVSGTQPVDMSLADHSGTFEKAARAMPGRLNVVDRTRVSFASGAAFRRHLTEVTEGLLEEGKKRSLARLAWAHDAAQKRDYKDYQATVDQINALILNASNEMDRHFFDLRGKERDKIYQIREEQLARIERRNLPDDLKQQELDMLHEEMMRLIDHFRGKIDRMVENQAEALETALQTLTQRRSQN